MISIASTRLWRILLIILLLSVTLLAPSSLQAQEVETGDALTCPLTGNLRDSQGQPVAAVEARLTDGEGTVLLSAESQPDGRYLLAWPADETLPNSLELHYERPHFETAAIQLTDAQQAELNRCQAVAMPLVELERQITPAFWIAAVVFAIVLSFIAMGTLHNTLAALLGASVLFAFSYLGPLIDEGLFIFEFERSLEFVDWNVIFLIMGMMIVIAVVERTGIFQWSALQAYKLSGGRKWLLVIILMVITGVASAFLDNVTTMLLMTPITIQIALSLGMNPLALLMPEVMASNVVGISTLVGTPTNILIGSFAEISFSDFLINLTPGVVLATAGLVLYHEYIYRKELRSKGDQSGISNVLLARLEERGRIEEPDDLRKAGIVGAGMIILFVVGEQFHLLPSVTAIMGATALMVWIRPDIDEMIESVDWTTLVFFIALFICVGGVQEVGLISFIAQWIGDLVGENLILAMLAVTWLSAFLSTVIANIPFTAAMLPVVGFLSGNIPGADNKVLFYCLSVGSAMGGNGSLIGASANMVTAGISDRAGTPITYIYFLKKGLPALVITVALATIWLFIRFL